MAGSDEEALLDTERQVASWHRAHAGAPGVELHDDPDVTWLLTQGSAWSNCAVMVRFTEQTVRRRLTELYKRYAAHERGMGVWASPHATPATLERELRIRGLRCRKRFPAMACDSGSFAGGTEPGFQVTELDDHERYRIHGHPNLGPITTPRREACIATMEHIAQRRPRQTWEWVALDGDVPVGCVTMHLSDGVAGLYDVAVRASHRRRGIGTALVRRACAFAFSRQARRAVLVATGEGEAMYPRAGFREVGRLAYWYKSFQRPE